MARLAGIPTVPAWNVVIRAWVVAALARNVTIVARIVARMARIVTAVARIVAGIARILAMWRLVRPWVASMVWIGARNDQPVPGIDAAWVEDAVGVGDGLDCGAVPPGDAPQVFAPAHDVNDPCATGGAGRWGCPHSLAKEHN
jgi:hypothetical protein